MFHPSNRIIRTNSGDDVAMQQKLMATQPMVIFAECFSQKITFSNELMGITAREIQAGKDRAQKRLEETYELGCPMYVCALVATLLHQMWNNRLTIIRGDDRDALGGTYSSSSFSPSSSSALSAASATSALIVQQTHQSRLPRS